MLIYVNPVMEGGLRSLWSHGYNAIRSIVKRLGKIKKTTASNFIQQSDRYKGDETDIYICEFIVFSKTSS